MNSIPGREPRPDRSRYQSTQRNPQRGCYLALTFGTLLSSQGADAHQLDPHGLRRWRLVVQPYVATGCSRRGIVRLASRPRAAHREPYTTPEGGAQGVRDPDPRPAQSPRRLSIPTVRPGWRAISRTASSTPGMKEARSYESCRSVKVSPGAPKS